ncbi:MAG TPA: O-methyltransferase [Chloroflexota bacterium]|jgi:caffeoyl-CoA O-methyltransferase
MADPKSRSRQSNYWTPAVGEYLDGLYLREDEGMRDAVASIERAGMPQIQVSASDGRILEVVLRAAGARKVVELGTLAGYSAQWIARAIGPDGHLWTIEASPKHAEVSRGVLARAGLGERVTILSGPGMEVLPTIEREGPFDAVFVDANKEDYPRYVEWATRNLRPGGIVVGDNTYLFGRLAGVEPESADQARTVEAMRRFHELVARDYDAVTLPTPDGLTVGVKR